MVTSLAIKPSLQLVRSPDTACGARLHALDRLIRDWFEQHKGVLRYTTDFIDLFNRSKLKFHSARQISKDLARLNRIYYSRLENDAWFHVIDWGAFLSSIHAFHEQYRGMDNNNVASFFFCGTSEDLAPIGALIHTNRVKSSLRKSRDLILSNNDWTPQLNAEIVANSVLRQMHASRQTNIWNFEYAKTFIVFVSRYKLHRKGRWYAISELRRVIGCRVTLAELLIALKIAFVEKMSWYVLTTQVGDKSVYAYTLKTQSTVQRSSCFNRSPYGNMTPLTTPAIKRSYSKCHDIAPVKMMTL